MAIKDWKLVRKREGTGTSIVYKKEQYFLEIFADSSWYGNNHNVIIYDSSQKSLQSSFGKAVQTEYFDTKLEAERFANLYMRKN